MSGTQEQTDIDTHKKRYTELNYQYINMTEILTLQQYYFLC